MRMLHLLRVTKPPPGACFSMTHNSTVIIVSHLKNIYRFRHDFKISFFFFKLDLLASYKREPN